MDQPVDSPDVTQTATQYALACHAAGIGVWELHVGEDSLAYSNLARSIFGFPPDGVITREMVHATIHPEDLEIVLAAARRAMDPSLRSNEHYFYRIHRVDTHELRWLRAHGIAQFEGAGSNARAVHYAGSVQDVTELELTRQKLAASEERLRLAVDAAEMAVWDLDLEAGIVAHSPDLNRMLGFPEDAQPTLEEFRSRYAPGEQERLEQEGAAARARGETSFQTRARYVVPGKGPVTYVLRAALARNATMEGGPQRVIGVLFDATEQVRAEERLVTMNKELRHRLKNMANLAGIFARQTWSGHAQLANYLGRIRALALSADLMFGTREENLRLQDVIDRSLEPFRRAEGEPFFVQGPDMAVSESVFTGMALLLHELATNAVKHGALSVPEGHVRMTWETTGDHLRATWREVNGPSIKTPIEEGFGHRLILSGALPPPHSVELDFRPEGLVATISIRLDEQT